MTAAPLFVVGFRAEALLLPRGARVLTSGGRHKFLAQRLDRAISAVAPSGIISLGIAGGLHPNLIPGQLVLADAVVDPDGRHWPVCHRWRMQVAQHISRVHTGKVAAVNEVVSTAQNKAWLHRLTGALVADMESGCVVRAAARLGVPALVLRAVADPAGARVPQAAALGLDALGRARVGRVLVELVARPRDMRALMRVAGHTRQALSALKLATRAASPALLA